MSTREIKEGERDHWQIQKYILLLETRKTLRKYDSKLSRENITALY